MGTRGKILGNVREDESLSLVISGRFLPHTSSTEAKRRRRKTKRRAQVSSELECGVGVGVGVLEWH